MIDEWQREVEKGCARWGEVVPTLKSTRGGKQLPQPPLVSALLKFGLVIHMMVDLFILPLAIFSPWDFLFFLNGGVPLLHL